jgi:hypothetical protein
MHPNAMLTTPNEHPQLTAVDVRLRKTRGPIGLITLKSRSQVRWPSSFFAPPPKSSRRYLAQAHRCEIRADPCRPRCPRTGANAPQVVFCRVAPCNTASNISSPKSLAMVGERRRAGYRIKAPNEECAAAGFSDTWRRWQ